MPFLLDWHFDYDNKIWKTYTLFVKTLTEINTFIAMYTTGGTKLFKSLKKSFLWELTKQYWRFLICSILKSWVWRKSWQASQEMRDEMLIMFTLYGLFVSKNFQKSTQQSMCWSKNLKLLDLKKSKLHTFCPLMHICSFYWCLYL